MAERGIEEAKLVQSLKCLHYRSAEGLLGLLDFEENTTDDEGLEIVKKSGVRRIEAEERIIQETTSPEAGTANSYHSEINQDIYKHETANGRVPIDSGNYENVKETIREQPCSLVSEITKDLTRFKVVSNKSKVYVGNISYRVRTMELKEFFGIFGKVLYVQIIQDRVKKRSRGFGFVTFSSPLEAERAINSDDYERTLEGRVMSVVPAQRKRKGHKDTGPDTSLEDAVQQFINGKDDSENQDNESCTIEKLDDDTMLHIFSYMGLRDRVNLERVCHRWRNLAVQSWNTVQHLEFRGIFSLFKGGLTDDILLSLFRKGCTNLRSLNLSASPFLLTDFAVHCIAKHCKNLREVNLTGVEVSTSSLKTLSQKCSLIEQLTLRKCYKAGEKGFWWFFKQSVNLKHVDVAESRRITGQCFFMLPSSIKSLNLCECIKLVDAGLKYVAMRCQNLKAVDLSDCTSLTDTGLLDLTQTCTEIESFKFSGAPKEVTMQGLLGIGNLQQLRELNISRCEAMEDEFLFLLGRSCIHLTTLNIEACGKVTDAGIESLIGCYQLKNIMLSYIDQISHVGLAQLARNGSLENLEARACQGVTDQAVECILRGCPVLARLDLSGCLSITEGCLGMIATHSSSPDRREGLIVILGGTLVSEESAKRIQSQCPRCEFVIQDFSVELLRTDRDPYFGMRDFEPDYSDEEEEVEEDEFARDDHVLGDDFLEADDPAMLNDYENWS